ncbi:hypothetical protein [Piscinibacter sp. XHJ-5]|uniref:hypothetical protein n=1 Tax=Piscinibacter sp. XHJ-5 TaxID=3037797 RepID=UPI002452DE86|nr:hypothetical protein [Piscinibacter sp. XHJ-5]
MLKGGWWRFSYANPFTKLLGNSGIAQSLSANSGATAPSSKTNVAIRTAALASGVPRPDAPLPIEPGQCRGEASFALVLQKKQQPRLKLLLVKLGQRFSYPICDCRFSLVLNGFHGSLQWWEASSPWPIV